MRLADFITQNLEAILTEWESFARTIEPPALTMDDKALRNHAGQMLQALALDLRNPQTSRAQSEKSKGNGPRLSSADTAAETHALARLQSGYTIEQLVSEYRALRASVLRLWADDGAQEMATDRQDIMRFNEAVDQLLAESVARYAQLVKQSQHMLMAVLGHDLRNPLGAAMNSAAYLQRVPDLPPKALQAVNRIHQSSQRMGRLIEDLIDFTRANLGIGLPCAPRPMNLGAACQAAVDECRAVDAHRVIDLIVEGEVEGLWDENRVAQVMANLIGNALHHGAADMPVKVRVFYGENDDAVATVWNDGSPIPLEKVQSIFEPLIRFADQSAEQVTRQGLGLGLYIAREAVLAHGGAIAVESTVERGTTFTVRLPRNPPPQPAA